MKQNQKIVPVILSGGSGVRLWPISRDSYPKHFIGITNSQVPVIQETLNRVADTARFYPPLMTGNNAHRFLLAEHMRQCGIASPRIIIEPVARNTAPAIAVAALYVQEQYGNALMLVLPTDHHINNEIAFAGSIKRAAEVAAKGLLVTFGIQPEKPETGYGYIRRGEQLDKNPDVFKAASFVEKPDAETAEKFIRTGEYFWNSGMFMLPVGLLLEEMQCFQPELMENCCKALAESTHDLDFIRLEETAFSNAPEISIDYALMELTKRAAIVALDCGWSDTGAWDLLWNMAVKDKNGNSAMGECYAVESSNCYIRSENGTAVATLGVENLVVISTKDAVLVANKDKTSMLKTLIAQLKQKNPALVSNSCRVYRPWGCYETLHTGDRFQVKRLTVKPGEKLSLQLHHYRAEHWIVVSGCGRVTCNEITKTVMENESFYVPCGSVHSIENPGETNLDIIEVQSGFYLGEDDIVRFEDRYGRISA